MSQQEMRDALAGFFGGINVAAVGFLKKLDEVKHQVKLRQDELNPNIAFDILASRWLSEGVPGRFDVWLAHFAPHPYAYYQTHFADLVLSLETAFKAMKADESALERAFKERLSSPEAFVERLQKAFDAKDVQVVTHIVHQLSRLTDASFSVVKIYAVGLLQELKGNAKEALMHYLYTDPSKQLAIIQQQVFPLAFALNEYQSGAEALAALSQHNPRYLPLYADALIMLGEFENAIATYLSYPYLHEDTASFIGLLRLLVQHGDVEQANRLLELAESAAKIDQNSLKTFVDSLNQTG
jgi:tetratricopeptide (TPR) repeat protein